ncbi:MAG TPA: PDC sensor domain-containing protein, partial [Coleofasciculaceae cyanobacterium]
MTQLSPNSNPRNNSNGRGSYTTGFPFEGQTAATNYPPSGQLQAYPGQQASKLSGPGDMDSMLQLPKHRRSQGQGFRWLSASLRIKATILAIAIGTLPVLGIGTFAYFTASQGVEKDAFNTLRFGSQDLLDKLTLFMSERYTDIQFYADLAIFTDAKLRDSLTTEQKNAVLERYVKTSGIYNSLAVTDLNGDFLYKSDGDTLDNATGLDWFDAVKKTDRPFITEPRISQATSIFSVLLAAPIKDSATGKTTAIIRGRFPVSVLNEVFRVSGERGQDIFVFDSKNTIFTSSVDAAAGKTLEKVFPLMAANVKKLGRTEQTIYGA